MWNYYDGGEKKGPVSQDELLKLYNTGAISGDTQVQAEGAGETVAFAATLIFKSAKPLEPAIKEAGFGENQLYEYDVILWDRDSFDAKKQPDKELKGKINELAREGWELLGTENADTWGYGNTFYFYLFFRRRVG